MPFDSLPENNRHNLVRLRDQLRAALPENFAWDYSFVLRKNECGSAGCALGLAMVTMPDFAVFLEPIEPPLVKDVAAWFGITEAEFTNIFLYCPLGRDVKDITPAEVAHRIDRVLLMYEHAQQPTLAASGPRHLGGGPQPEAWETALVLA